MLRSINLLTGYKIEATDGEIGHVHDFFFDDESWTIRYLVVDTGNWLPGRKVLISPEALGQPDWLSGKFLVMLSKDQIEDSPGIDTTKPVSRQQEAELHNYYNWPLYWTPAGLMTPEYPYTAGGQTDMPPKLEEELEMVDQQAYASSLRSAKEVRGYHIQATDGEIGHVEDFMADDTTWVIRYMVVDTRNWLPGRKVQVLPEQIETVAWAERKVYISISQADIENSPEIDPSTPVMLYTAYSLKPKLFSCLLRSEGICNPRLRRIKPGLQIPGERLQKFRFHSNLSIDLVSWAKHHTLYGLRIG